MRIQFCVNTCHPREVMMAQSESDAPLKLEEILSRLTPAERKFITRLIDKDPLTGVYNRRKFDQDLTLVIAMSDRTRHGSSLLMIDIDHFKQYNDTYGHQKGDEALRHVTQSIEASLREYDRTHIYRYGGEEFVVIIPNVLIGEARMIGNRLREKIKHCVGVTVSVGISHYKQDADNLKTLIDNADKALYAAKNRGRDRVEVFSDLSNLRSDE